MKKIKHLYLLFLNIFICLTLCFSQNKFDSIVFYNQLSKYEVEFSDSKGKFFKHEIIFYKDSTFKFTREFMYQNDTTMGVYSSNNNEIILNSFDKYRRCFLNVDEFKTINISRKYVLRGLGLGISIIEIDSDFNEICDTLHFEKNINDEFVGTFHYKRSYHKNIIGFKVYKFNQFCGEYFFMDKNSKKFVFELIDTMPRNFFYLKNNCVKIINKDSIIIDTYIPKKFVRRIPEYLKEPLNLDEYRKKVKD
jgi:hypothetical protein